MTKTQNVHVLVANRERGGTPIAIETIKGTLEVPPSESREAELDAEQFDILRSQQRQAVARKPGVLRLVDHWLVEKGKRVDRPSDPQAPAADAASD